MAATDSSAAPETLRVSTMELFFDLVFVFTITQLTTALAGRPTPAGLLGVVLMLGVIWWMYGGYAWLTNEVQPDRLDRRLLLMAGMAGFLVTALAIPGAFTRDGAAFGAGYLAVTAVHAVLFSRAGTGQVVRAILRLAPLNLLAAALVLAGGIAGGIPQYALWAAAFVLEGVTPWFTDVSSFRIQPAHFVERHGLVLLIVLGESVVAVGIGVSGQRVGPELIGVAMLGLAVVAGLWLLYFGGDDERAEAALVAAPARRRPRLALNAYGYAFVPVVLGVVGLAAGFKRSIGHHLELAHPEPALAMGAGVALFLWGGALFRLSLGIHPNRYRSAAGALALATIGAGLAWGSVAQLAGLLALLALTVGAEKLGRRSRA